MFTSANFGLFQERRSSLKKRYKLKTDRIEIQSLGPVRNWGDTDSIHIHRVIFYYSKNLMAINCAESQMVAYTLIKMFLIILEVNLSRIK